MALDTAAVANRLVTLVAGLPGLGDGNLGAPQTADEQLDFYVAAAGQTIERIATGAIQREARYLVMLAYRLDGNEAAAEAALMAAVDALIVAVLADLTLGGVCLSAEIDLSLPDVPEYAARSSGAEIREFPVIVTAIQEATYAVNP